MLFELLLWKIPISEQFPDTDMHGVFRLFCLLMVACCCRGQSEFVYPSMKEDEYPDVNFIRKKRSAVNLMLTGVNAVRKLLAGTKRIRSQSKYHRRYSKEGGVKMAYQDFYSVNPESVSQRNLEGVVKLYGYVGDREIILRDPTRSTKYGSGTIYVDVIDTKRKRDLSNKPRVKLYVDQFVDRIVYKND